MKLLFITLILFSHQVIAGVKITCLSDVEMDYQQVKTLDNQTAKDEWKKIKTQHSLNIELRNDNYILINGKKEPIIKKSAGVLYLTSSSKVIPGTNKNQGIIVIRSLVINMAIPTVTKTSLMAKYFLSSEIQAIATNYKCKWDI